jgi:hypothetical protein
MKAVLLGNTYILNHFGLWTMGAQPMDLRYEQWGLESTIIGHSYMEPRIMGQSESEPKSMGQ